MASCVKCGASSSGAVRFCPKCGQSVGSPKAVQQTAPNPSSFGPAVCRYHPEATVVGHCEDCGNPFCNDCAVPIAMHGTTCLDCGARIAQKKLRQAVWAAAIGLPFGLGLAGVAISGGSWWAAPFALLVYAYLFPAVLFGWWHYGGRIWDWLFRSRRLRQRLATESEQHSTANPIAILIVFVIRAEAALFIGAFGGGIIQVRRCRRIVALHEALTASPANSSRAAATA
jgi:hypothetical protein